MVSPFVSPSVNCPAYTGQFAVYAKPPYYYTAYRTPSIPSPHFPESPKPDQRSIQKQSSAPFPKSRMQSGIDQLKKGAIFNILVPLIGVYDTLFPAIGKLLMFHKVPAATWKNIAREMTTESLACAAAIFSIGAFKPMPEPQPKNRTESGLNAMRTLFPGIISGEGTLALMLGLTDPQRKKPLLPYFQEQLQKCGHWFIPLSILMGAALSGGAFCWGAYRFGKPSKKDEDKPILEQIRPYAPLISASVFAVGGIGLLNFFDKPNPLKSKLLKLLR